MKSTTLNLTQDEAVKHTEGPLLILAGAGTGKTLVLINRIVHILREGKALPHQILATTFTNKAAGEIRERIFNLIPQMLPWVGTFHSIAAKILRSYPNVMNLSSRFTILDADDQVKLIKSIMGDLNIDSKKFEPKVMNSIIQRWKDLALKPDRISNSDLKSEFQRTALKIYTAYNKKLEALDAVDFGDLLMSNIEIFRKTPEILEQYQEDFKYIMVDEYQDTNVAQYMWLRMLTHPRNNLCCVGDDDQSIYGWRGAEVGNILKFDQHFPNAKVIKLEQNYRSTHHILRAASALIANNSMRHDKTLWTDQSAGQERKIIIRSCWNDKEEANFIANEIKPKLAASTNKIAILVRALFQTRIIEECFINHLISYKVIGSLKFYDRQEIKDVMAYVKLVMKHNDDLSFERIINKPVRSIGKTSLEKIKIFANEQNISMFAASQHVIKDAAVGKQTCASLGRFLSLIKEWGIMADTKSPSELVSQIIIESGYRDMVKIQDALESTDRLENLKELLKALEEFSNITEFLEHIALISDNDDKNKEGHMVTIMSLHAAKGLEFDTVFLPGWEEGVFPHPRTIDESGAKGLEEERRLAYVGITRAKRHLYISHAMTRRVYNQWNSSLPSRFLKEIPKECYTAFAI